jgi:hypothetical protein
MTAGAILSESFRFGPYDVRGKDLTEVSDTVALALEHFGKKTRGWRGVAPKVWFERACGRMQLTVVVVAQALDQLTAKQIVDGVLRA